MSTLIEVLGHREFAAGCARNAARLCAFPARALTAMKRRRSRKPDPDSQPSRHATGYDEARAAQAAGDFAEAASLWTAAADQHGVTVDSQLALATCYLHLGSSEQALSVLQAAAQTWPGDERVMRRLAQLARALGHFDVALEAQQKLIEVAPDDPTLHLQNTVLANQTGQPAMYWRSLHLANDLYRERALRGDTASLAGHLRTLCRIGDTDAIHDVVRVVVAEAHRSPSAPLIRSAADALVWLGDIKGLSFLAEHIDDRELDSAALAETADLWVRLEQADRARALIERTSRVTKKENELRAWALVQQGLVEPAREMLVPVSFPNTVHHLRAYDTSLELSINEVRNPPPALEGEPALFTVCRNERERLPEWLEHYRRLGIKHIFVVDNGSTDETKAYLAEQPDVYLFEATGDFRRYASGRRWVNYLIESYGGNSWCLVTDVDEFFVFDGDDNGLAPLVNSLDDQGSQVMFAVMLDMFGERLDDWAKDTDRPLGERFPYFEPATHLIGSRHAPYLSVSGGMRNRRLAAVMQENLLNAPVMVKAGTGTMFLNPHLTNPAIASTATGALLHYKFAVNPMPRSAFTSAKGVFARYLSQDLGALRDLDLSDGSLRYEDPAQLRRLGLIRG